LLLNQNNIYLTGIGGVGMTPLALYYAARGDRVEGSDLQPFRMASILQKHGINVHYQQNPENIHSSIQSLVYSAAIPMDNPELVKAKQLHIPCIHRIKALQDIVAPKQLLSVTGSYGKSTTTTFLSSISENSGLKPSWLIGADMLQYPCAKYSDSNYFILETDESQPSFLDFSPVYTILTNIGSDHLTNYNNDPNELKRALFGILRKTRKNVIIPSDVKRNLDPSLIDDSWITCGDQASNYHIIDSRTYFDGSILRTSFQVKGRYSSFTAEIPMPSYRNVMDALLSFALVEDIVGHIPNPSELFSALPVIDRRFQFIPTDSKALLIDDEGDSPDVIQQVIKDALLYFPTHRVVVFIQPHRYSRLENLFTEYVQSLLSADEIVVLPVYGAGESQKNRKNEVDLYEALRSKHTGKVHCMGSLEEASSLLYSFLCPNTTIITLGPGDVWKLYQDFQI
jgi:UDP-N-acetylmuramate--alanine ligase